MYLTRFSILQAATGRVDQEGHQLEVEMEASGRDGKRVKEMDKLKIHCAVHCYRHQLSCLDA